ncbi:response regulator transcription factor [Petroclostridium sp. X23]|uniref:response regulator transcription factor n=1 Tax=Petroclostridium sp. X23 TaxID=3045146 RepID=UPI0024AC9216|nr:response regulator transcription factor [Petroclostridium sp. X23]WHH58791.1 response regulator transcription factor [Petroclostridium sp. X23]
MIKKSILLVDDDPSIHKLLKAALEKNLYTAISCNSGEEALEALDRYPISAIILDVILPGMDGLETLKRIRNHPLHHHIPIIMLTCKNSEIETVVGLEMGADDYLGKPVRYYELLTRLKMIFKRRPHQTGDEPKTLSMHGIEVDVDTRTAYINKLPVVLTYREFELLTLLVRNPGRVFSRDMLLDEVWYDEQFLETRTVDVHIRGLRKKIQHHGLNPNIIETIRSVGYRMTLP